MSARWFVNLPAMSDVAAVDAAADKLGAHRVAGYRAEDGLRANVEIDQAVAELLERAALQVELRGCALKAIAEGWKSNS
jgi:hypothetical protein